MAVLTYIAVFLTGFAASWVGSMVGGGGLLSIPFLMFVGLPPQIAIATNKFSSLGLKLAAGYKYWKEERILWQYVLPLTVISLTGAIIGSVALINVNTELLSTLVAVFIVLLLPTLFINPDVGTQHRDRSRYRLYRGYFLYAMITVWAAFFGGGSGTLFRYVLVLFLGTTMVEASGTLTIPGIVLTVTAVGIFAWNGIINYVYGGIMLGGMIAGGYVGAHTAVVKGNHWVKIVFAVVVVASAAKLIFF